MDQKDVDHYFEHKERGGNHLKTRSGSPTATNVCMYSSGEWVGEPDNTILINAYQDRDVKIMILLAAKLVRMIMIQTVAMLWQ